jgi:outer membrane lipoprotein-sorting protein
VSRPRAPLFCFVIAFLVTGSVADICVGDTDAEALLREVDSRLQPDSYEAYRKLINIEPDGRRKEFVLYSAKKGRDKVITLFLEPASEKGRATLRLGDNMWLYIPNVGRPLRITSLQSVTGGIFTNSDIMRLDYSQEYSVVDQAEDGTHLVLTLQAKTKAVAYDRLNMWVDQERKLPHKIECYAATGMLIKTLHFKEIKDYGEGIRRPAVVETDSPLHKGYRSVMIFGEIKPRSFEEEVFTRSFLPRVDSLR